MAQRAQVAEAHRQEQGEEAVSGASGPVLRLHADGADVHLVPGQRLQHLQLPALGVETEEVHRGVAQGQQEAVEGQALD